MLFTSPVFLFLFLPVVVGVHYLLPRPLRNSWLLITSLFFYAWGEGHVLMLMLGTIATTFFAARLIESGWRKTGLGLGVLSSLAALLYFKYFNFAVDNLIHIADLIGADAETFMQAGKVALPIGISFYTFQCLSYVIDVHRGQTAANRSFIDYATYVALFPQLIAGPIVRYVDVRRQLAERHASLERAVTGASRFVIGLFKKTVVANSCAAVADPIFSAPVHELSTPLLWAGALAYSLQLYLDFSAYSDMAIGLGRILGFEFLENFNHPYAARGIKDFWRRWHISLSTWFRDYLYIPLGGNRASPARIVANLFIVFFATGLWHGASWSFVAWGLYHGCFLVLERGRFGDRIARASSPLVRLYTLLVVIVGWVLFRADDLSHAMAYLSGMAIPRLGDAATSSQLSWFLFDAHAITMLLLGVVLCMPLAQGLRSRLSPDASARASGQALRYSGLVLLLLLSLSYIAAGTYNPFIYFRF